MSTLPRAFVMGWPIAHSRSPLIHRHWLYRYRIGGSYEAEAVRPDDVPAFLANLPGRFVGGNVTVPHKEAVFGHLETLTGPARRLGAVNTLWLEGDRICGDNTDAYGFAANLDAAAPDWRDRRRALVLGAGGAARAVLFALLEAGYDRIDLLNRTESRARSLADHFGPEIKPSPLDRLAERLPEAELVVNTTSAGLHEGESLDLPWHLARGDALATDIVYVPLETPFLAAARDAGLATIDGLGMLLHQAVPGFERWFGVRPEVDETLRIRIERDIEGAGS